MDKNESKYILAIDHGTSGLKAALVSVYGEIIGFEYEPTKLYFLSDGGVEQNPEEWWNALVIAARRLIHKKTVSISNITAICVSSTFSTTVAVDKTGKALMNSLTWLDSRGAPYIRKVVGGFPSVMGYKIDRIIKWISRTGGGPQFSGKDDIAHILFIKYKYPEIYDKTYKFLGSKDYLNLKLSGEFAASYDSIMLFWVTDTRDVNNIRYDDCLIKYLGINKDKLPSLAASTSLLGNIRADIAEELGLHNDVKVFLGSPDHQSACVGSGAVRDFEGHLYIGTSSWIECIVPFKKTDIFHSIASLPTAIPGKYQCINEQDIAGGVLSFLLDNIIYHDNELKTNERLENPYSVLDIIAERVPAGSNKLIFTPWLNGERTPVDTTTLRAGLFNMSMKTNLNDIVRAFYEGVAYNTRWSLCYVEKFIGHKMDILNIIGGGARSNVWCQIFADVLNRAIRKVKEPLMANVRGAAFIASVGMGDINFNDIPNIIKYECVFQPNPQNRQIYDELFNEFIFIYKKNKSIYNRLNRI